MATTGMPILETQRLRIRPFVMDDLGDAHRLFDRELRDADVGSERLDSLADRARWLQWAALNIEQLARLHQPPYGDRAIVPKASGELIGACGFVPCLQPFAQLPGLAPADAGRGPGTKSTEFGLFYAISPAHRRRGYASEATRALVDYAFGHLRLARVVAETSYDNLASMGVMRALGMRIERNPQPDPPELQVVGVLENGG